MKHSFLATIIATGLLVIAFLLIYSYYRSHLAKQALDRLHANKSKPVIGFTSFILIIFTVFLTMFVIIVSSDVTLAAYRFSSTCSNLISNKDPLATCYNGFGKEIYADNKLALKNYNSEHPSKKINLQTLLNYSVSNLNLNDVESKIVNSMVFYNVVIQTRQSDFIVEDKLHVKIISKQDTRLTFEVKNLDSKDLTLNMMYPISVFSKNRIVVPITINNEVVEDERSNDDIGVLKPGETKILIYDYPKITVPYVSYELRVQGNNYTFEGRWYK